MAVLEWDKIGERFYETGVDHVVLYPQVESAYPKGVAWSGVTSISENSSGGEANDQYADNIKYLVLRSAEQYGVTIECFYYPEEWKACDGTTDVIDGVSIGQQARKNFGLSFRTRLGNDTDGDAAGYKLHLVYNCSATPSEKSYGTVNDSPEANTLSYEVSTIPVTINKTIDGKQLRPTSCITIDSTAIEATKLKAIEDKLYGTTNAEASLPTPDELFTLLESGS